MNGKGYPCRLRLNKVLSFEYMLWMIVVNLHTLGSLLVYMSVPCQCPGENPSSGNKNKSENAEADREHAWAKTLKAITWPDMDDDALPSTYVPKVLGCLGKWQIKMSELSKTMAGFGDDECIPAFLIQKKSDHQICSLFSVLALTKYHII